MKIYMNKEEFKPQRSLESYTEKEKWDSLSGLQRVRYVWDYYKLPIIIVLIVVYAIGWNIYRKATYKEPILYAGYVNFAPEDAVTEELSNDFLTSIEANLRKERMEVYKGWYLTTDQESEYYAYNYASQMKILGSIDGELLDVVYLNREAFDAFSQNGYLYDLDKLLKGSDIYEDLKPFFVQNREILTDNAKDINFDATVEYVSEDIEYNMGLDLTNCPRFADTQYTDTVYLAVIANTPRPEMVINYLSYLYKLS